MGRTQLETQIFNMKVKQVVLLDALRNKYHETIDDGLLSKIIRGKYICGCAPRIKQELYEILEGMKSDTGRN